MKFIYLPYQRWDAMYDALPEEVVAPVIVGGNLLACDFEGEREKVRVVRGLESQIGLLEARMLWEHFDPSEPSPLGTGIIPQMMAKELIDEGKVIPQRPVTIGIGNRRAAYPAVPTDVTARIPPSQMRHDLEPKPKKRKKKSKSRTRKLAKKRKR